MTDKLVDIKTGQPVEPSVSSGEQRKTLNQNGKRWAKLKELHEQGGFIMSTISGEFTFDEIAVNLDALIDEEEQDAMKEQKRKEYLKRKSP